MIRRLLAAALLAAFLPAPGSADGRPTLRGDLVVNRDALTLGDLVANVPPALAGTPLFRAPPLGQQGTVQAVRILAAAGALGLSGVESAGRSAITVTRAARTIPAAEIEAAVRKALVREAGADPLSTGILFDGPAPALVLPPEIAEDAVASEVVFDRRTRRVAATVWVGPSPGDRRSQVRVVGQVVELVEVAVLGRGLERSESVRATDVTVERRPRDGVAVEAVWDGSPLEGRVARRQLAAGTALRAADLIRPDLVARGDLVTVVYELPGVSLSLRATATAAGALGDAVSVINPQSKKTLQGVVVGPGRVSVSAPSPGRLATAAAPRS